NAGDASAIVQVVGERDITAPVVSLDAPPEVAIGGVLSLKVEASDETGISSIDVLVEGAVVHTATAAPFTVDYPVTSSFAPGTVLQLRAVAHDFSGNEAVAVRTSVVTTTLAVSRSLVTGEIYDDTSGLPLAGVSIAVSGIGSDGRAFASQAMTDERGRFPAPATAGAATAVDS